VKKEWHIYQLHFLTSFLKKDKFILCGIFTFSEDSELKNKLFLASYFKFSFKFSKKRAKSAKFFKFLFLIITFVQIFKFSKFCCVFHQALTLIIMNYIIFFNLPLHFTSTLGLIYVISIWFLSFLVYKYWPPTIVIST